MHIVCIFICIFVHMHLYMYIYFLNVHKKKNLIFQIMQSWRKFNKIISFYPMIIQLLIL